jgi:AhpD family alkylhydroperoxidase
MRVATTLDQIDPALSLMKEFSRRTLGTAAAIQKMRQEVIFADGRVPARYKVMAAALWAVSARCEPCIRYYIQQAAKLGVTEEELGEFLAIGSTMGGCVGEMWALKAFAAYREQSAAAEASCCHG